MDSYVLMKGSAFLSPDSWFLMQHDPTIQWSVEENSRLSNTVVFCTYFFGFIQPPWSEQPLFLPKEVQRPLDWPCMHRAPFFSDQEWPAPLSTRSYQLFFSNDFPLNKSAPSLSSNTAIHPTSEFLLSSLHSLLS